VAVTLLVYARSLGGEFLRGDDEPYVTRNPVVQSGLTPGGVAWAFRLQGHSANWHPLTWISHMTDVSLFGMHPAGHHTTNVLFHAASTLLLFLVLARATGRLWPPALVAALFALHPLHVESVAWIAERKDVLSTCFWMLTLGAYVRYVERPGAWRYGAVAGCLALGLMAKPMLVTLPFVLLLLDVWPLRRRQDRPGRPAVGWGRLVGEKVPLFLLVALSSVVTFLVQEHSGAVSPVGDLPVSVRIGNAVASYGAYIGKMLLPVNLAAYYPHPGLGLDGSRVLAGSLVLAAVTALVLWQRRRAYLAVGWLWYLGTLVPVIGLVQVGDQAMADRYTYVPLVGLFVMIAWGGADLLGRRRSGLAAGLAAAVLLPLAGVTWAQIGVWHDSASLYSHALRVTGPNHFTENNLAQALNDRGRTAEAAEHYAAAVALNPGWAEGYSNLGNALVKLGRTDEAIEKFRTALDLKHSQTAGGDANTAVIEYSLALALVQAGRRDEARQHLREAVRLAPDLAVARFALGKELEVAGDRAGAIEQYRAAVAAEPGMFPAWNNLAVELYRDGDYVGAWKAVDAGRALGHEPAAGFLKALSARMPDPGGSR